jgi:hypothetical protein
VAQLAPFCLDSVRKFDFLFLSDAFYDKLTAETKSLHLSCPAAHLIKRDVTSARLQGGRLFPEHFNQEEM